MFGKFSASYYLLCLIKKIMFGGNCQPIIRLLLLIVLKISQNHAKQKSVSSFVPLQVQDKWHRPRQVALLKKKKGGLFVAAFGPICLKVNMLDLVFFFVPNF
jgi:hypothetical protein